MVSGRAENALPIKEEGPQASSDSAQVCIIESVSNSLAPAPVGNTFILGRSQVNHKLIQDYVNKGYLKPDILGHQQFCLPSKEMTL